MNKSFTSFNYETDHTKELPPRILIYMKLSTVVLNRKREQGKFDPNQKRYEFCK